MRKTLLAVLMLLLIGGAFYFLQNRSSQNTSAQSITSLQNVLNNDSHQHNHDHSQAHSIGTDQKLPPAISTFNYKNEQQILQEHLKQWPQSKAQLLNAVLKPDAFKENKIAVEPHSILDIVQRQMGAVKVASMRALIEKESLKSEKIKTLQAIINGSDDETIKTIAQEALKSVQKDRPFFRDTLDAISNLPTSD